MRKGVVIYVFLISISLNGQERLSDLLSRYDSVNKCFVAHKDTAAINTWLNIMISNKYFESLSDIDSQIKKVLIENSTSDTLMGQLKLDLDIEKSQNAALSAQLESLKHEFGFYRNLFYLVVFICLLFLISSVIFIFIYKRSTKEKSRKELELKKYYTQLAAAKNEIEESNKIQNALASDLNKTSKQLNDRIESLEKLNSDLEDEKLMLDNQIIEIRKAWELELEKRREIENQKMDYHPSQTADENKDLIDQLSAKLQDAENECLQLKNKLKNTESTDKVLLEKKARIEKLQRELKSELEKRQIAEKELALLLEKIKDISNSYSS